MHFTFLQEILHLVDRQDMRTLYGMVTKYYTTHTPEGAGLFLLGDLHVLFDSQYPTGKGLQVWENSHHRKVCGWKFYPFCHVHVLETTSGVTVCVCSKTRSILCQ